LETIKNHAGPVLVELTIALGVLCPHAGEPQPGSTLTWHYTAADKLLALGAARAWPEQQKDEPLDLETFTRRAAEQASAVLGVVVQTTGHYILKGGIALRCDATSS
jgi:hypothetical protein